VTGSSQAIFPSSTSIPTRVAVKDLVLEPMAKIVSSVTGRFSSMSAKPNPRARMTSSSLTMAIAMPGTWCCLRCTSSSSTRRARRSFWERGAAALAGGAVFAAGALPPGSTRGRTISPPGWTVAKETTRPASSSSKRMPTPGWTASSRTPRSSAGRRKRSIGTPGFRMASLPSRKTTSISMFSSGTR